MVLACSPAEAGALLAEQVAAWGGEWRPDAPLDGRVDRHPLGGEIALPVAAGLRRGLVEGRVSIAAADSGSRVVLELTAATWHLNTAAVVILAFGAGGALLVVAWPLYPALLGLAPLGALAALSAWLLVASRLRSSSPRDYLEALAASAERSLEP